MRKKVRPEPVLGQMDIRTYNHREPILYDTSGSDSDVSPQDQVQSSDVQSNTERIRPDPIHPRDFYASGEAECPYENCQFIEVSGGVPGTEHGFYLVRELQNGKQRWFYRCAYREQIGNKWCCCQYCVHKFSWKRAPEQRRGFHEHCIISPRTNDENEVDSAPACLEGNFAEVYRLLARNVCLMNMSLENGSSKEMFEMIWCACEKYQIENATGKYIETS